MKKSAKMMLMGLGLAAVLGGCSAKPEDAQTTAQAPQGESAPAAESSAEKAVSYTHLTLPTN